MKNLNLKYIIGEILLLFVGINLAIWFNNWNTSKRINADKKIAINKISDEINNNRLDVDSILINNQQILHAYRDLKMYYDGNTSHVKMSPEKFASLQNQYPNFFRVEDSTAVEDGLYRYRGTTYINLEIATLTEIAWKTTTSYNVSNKLNYDCLYELESMYNLQRRVQNEVNKSARALQKRDLEELMQVLEFLEQLGSQLKDSYASMLKNIKDCN